MTIGANDLVPVDRRDTTGAVGTYAAVALYGTTANVATVTQITGRTTGVTINAPVGNIVLISAANSATDSTFTVTNSFVDAGDVVVMSQKSGADPRRIAVTATAAGSFAVTSASITGTTTESPVYNFVVIKGGLV